MMILKQDLYNELRQTAAHLYSTQAMVRFVLNGVRFPEAIVDLNGAADKIWDSALSEAEKAGRLKEIITFMKAENPNWAIFSKLLAGIEDGSAYLPEPPLYKFPELAFDPGSKTSVLLVYDQSNFAMAAELKAQLRPLELADCINLLDMHVDLAGRNPREQWLSLTGSADIMLLLITGQFFGAENYCLQLAIAGRDLKKVVVPVLFEDTLWGRIPKIRDIAPLPSNGVPVSRWPVRSEALYNVAQGTERIVKRVKPDGPCR